jgi:hypothetical protein
MICAVVANAHTYQARIGFTPLSTWLTLGGLALGGACLMLDAGDIMDVLAVVPLTVGITVGGMFGYFALAKSVGLRADERGLAISRGPGRQLETIAWQQLQQIYLYRISFRTLRFRCVGVRLKSTAPGPALDPKRVPADVLRTSRGMLGWRVDAARLSHAVAHFAPDVEVIDLTAFNQSTGQQQTASRVRQT